MVFEENLTFAYFFFRKLPSFLNFISQLLPKSTLFLKKMLLSSNSRRKGGLIDVCMCRTGFSQNLGDFFKEKSLMGGGQFRPFCRGISYYFDGVHGGLPSFPRCLCVITPLP